MNDQHDITQVETSRGIPAGIAGVLVVMIAGLFVITMYVFHPPNTRFLRPSQLPPMSTPSFQQPPARKPSYVQGQRALMLYFQAYKEAAHGHLRRSTRQRLHRVADPFAIRQLVDLASSPGDNSQHQSMVVHHITIREIEGVPRAYGVFSTPYGSLRIWVGVYLQHTRWRISRIEKTVPIEEDQGEEE